MVQKTGPLETLRDTFDPDDFRAHLRETLDIGAGYFIEFIFRDTNRLTGKMEARVADACQIVREVTAHSGGKGKA